MPDALAHIDHIPGIDDDLPDFTWVSDDGCEQQVDTFFTVREDGVSLTVLTTMFGAAHGVATQPISAPQFSAFVRAAMRAEQEVWALRGVQS